MGKVGQCTARAPTHAWWSAILTGRNALILIVAYLAVASVNNLAPVVSRVIRWASAWNRPVLSAVTMVCLTWTWCGQAQWLWASARALVHRRALCPRPATHGNLGRDQGMLEATQGLPYAPGPAGMPAPAFWGGVSHGADMQEFPNPAYGMRGPMCPCSIESISLGAGIGPHDGTQEASGQQQGDLITPLRCLRATRWTSVSCLKPSCRCATTSWSSNR